jgi:nitric oxide reductase activation protein
MFITDLVTEVGSKGSPEGVIQQSSFAYDPTFDEEEQGGPLEIKEPSTYLYDEWDYRMSDYRPRWCLLREKEMAEGDPTYFTTTLDSYAALAAQIRRQFELMVPQGLHKVKKQQDGDELELDAVIEAVVDRRSGTTPSEKVYMRRNKVERDVAVVFLMDMSASTAEAIDESRRLADEWDAPDDPLEYMFWLRSRRGEGVRRSYKRIVDLEKESLVLLIQALETIGDTYGIYGFSGYGRENVDFFVIKDIQEALSDKVKRRIDKMAPLQATRMGPAIRHAVTKLEKLEARTKFLILISDGRPQDRGYSREGVEKEYAIHDTKEALTEARLKGITPFCLTVDKEGHDYLRAMCQDMGYEVLADIHSLPRRLPTLYRHLTT